MEGTEEVRVVHGFSTGATTYLIDDHGRVWERNEKLNSPWTQTKRPISPKISPVPSPANRSKPGSTA